MIINRCNYALGQPVLGSVHPSIDGGQEHGLKTNFLGIVPVSSFFTPVQSGHHHEVWNKLKHKHEKLCYCVFFLLQATWVQHPSTIIQARMPVLLQSAGSGLLPDVFPAQPAHPLPLDLPKGDQLINMSSVDSIAQHQASGHVSPPPFHLQAQGQEDIYSSPVPSSLPVPHESSPTSPDVSFLQPSFLSPTYDRARHIAPGFWKNHKNIQLHLGNTLSLNYTLYIVYSCWTSPFSYCVYLCLLFSQHALINQCQILICHPRIGWK